MTCANWWTVSRKITCATDYDICRCLFHSLSLTQKMEKIYFFVLCRRRFKSSMSTTFTMIRHCIVCVTVHDSCVLSLTTRVSGSLLSRAKLFIRWIKLWTRRMKRIKRESVCAGGSKWQWKLKTKRTDRRHTATQEKVDARRSEKELWTIKSDGLMRWSQFTAQLSPSSLQLNKSFMSLNEKAKDCDALMRCTTWMRQLLIVIDVRHTSQLIYTSCLHAANMCHVQIVSTSLLCILPHRIE